MQVERMINGKEVLLVESEQSKYFTEKVFELMKYKNMDYMLAYMEVKNAFIFIINCLNSEHEEYRINLKTIKEIEKDENTENPI